MDDIFLPQEAESRARRSSHTSARNPPVEIITRGARRRWTAEQKREIVGERFGPDLTATEVARKYGIGSGQFYTWRQQILTLQTAVVTRAAPSFAKIELASDAPQPTAAPRPSEANNVNHPVTRCPFGQIEIILQSGAIVRIGAGVDAEALGRVLDVLNRR
jgi:transposase